MGTDGADMTRCLTDVPLFSESKLFKYVHIFKMYSLMIFIKKHIFNAVRIPIFTDKMYLISVLLNPCQTL